MTTLCFHCCTKDTAPSTLSYFTAYASLLLGIAIVAGNVLVIVSVFRDPYRNLRTPFNYFLVCLAASDLVVGTVTMPLSTVAHLQDARKRKTLLMKIMPLSYLISMSASVLSLAALCVDRRMAIVKPITYRSNLSLSRCLKIASGIWALSLSIPMLYFVLGLIRYLLIFVNAYVLVTLLILVVTYYQVDKKFEDQAKSLNRGRYRSEVSKFRNERKVTKTFLVILALFLSTYIPSIVFIYVLQFCDNCSCTFKQLLIDLEFLIICSNSIMNPIVCGVRLKPFRQAFKAVLSCQRKTKLQWFKPTLNNHVTFRKGSEATL